MANINNTDARISVERIWTKMREEAVNRSMSLERFVAEIYTNALADQRRAERERAAERVLVHTQSTDDQYPDLSDVSDVRLPGVASRSWHARGR